MKLHDFFRNAAAFTKIRNFHATICSKAVKAPSSEFRSAHTCNACVIFGLVATDASALVHYVAGYASIDLYLYILFT